MQYKTPPFLKKHSKAALIATAAKIEPKHVQLAIKLIESWGVELVLGENIFNEYNYFAGTDEERRNDLQAMLDNPELGAIFCARGGYGTSRIIDELDFKKFEQHPKWLIGFSDVTILHSRIHKLGFQSLHATMPSLYDREHDTDALQNIRKALFGEPHGLRATSNALNREGEAQAPMVGGNLSILVDQIGTATDIDYDGKILYLEDTQEYMYKIDRMMTQLKRSNKLKNLQGLVVGYMNGMKDEQNFGATAYEVIADVVGKYQYPVAYGLPFGHDTNNQPIISGSMATLDVAAWGASLYFSNRDIV